MTSFDLILLLVISNAVQNSMNAGDIIEPVRKRKRQRVKEAVEQVMVEHESTLRKLAK